MEHRLNYAKYAQYAQYAHPLCRMNPPTTTTFQYDLPPTPLSVWQICQKYSKYVRNMQNINPPKKQSEKNEK